MTAINDDCRPVHSFDKIIFNLYIRLYNSVALSWKINSFWYNEKQEEKHKQLIIAQRTKLIFNVKLNDPLHKMWKFTLTSSPSRLSIPLNGIFTSMLTSATVFLLKISFYRNKEQALRNKQTEGKSGHTALQRYLPDSKELEPEWYTSSLRLWAVGELYK